MLSTRFLHYKKATVVACSLLSLLTISLSGCGSSSNGDDSSGRSRMTGVYTYGFETEAFRPCGSTQSYWVTNSQVIQNAVPADYSAQGITSVYVDVDGTVGPSGSYGSLGLYEHELSVSQVYSGSTTIPDACQLAR